MSRLIFRNLPSELTVERFKAQLAGPATIRDATITDTKLVSKRRFAFVGYKSAEDAEKVQKWFDGTYAFGGGKVQVEVVRDDPLSSRPEKKARMARKEDQMQPQDASAVDSSAEAGPSKSLKDFMDVMKGSEFEQPNASTSTATGPAPSKGASRKGKERSIELEDANTPDEDVADDDAAWLARRQTTLTEDIIAAEPLELQGEVGVQTVVADPEEALILSTGRLFVRNLPFISSSSELSSHFSSYGTIEELHLPVSSQGEPLGTAFILFRESTDAVSAWKALDGKTFQGRILHVLPGRARPGQEHRVEGVGNNQGEVLGKIKDSRDVVKGKQDEKRKDAGTKGVNWASLYMNSDAVAASVAGRMGVSKADLLNPDSGSAAVKLALAETAVIAETKKYFEEAGIVLESLGSKVARSQTIILVKNIPYGTSIHTLTDLFAPHGTIKRILLPPSGTLGVVEYDNAHEAGKAFKALAYKRLGSAVLYLEKGPQGMFKAPSADDASGMSVESKEKAELAQRAVQAEETLREQPDEEDEAGSTLFLKNISFSTSSTRLASVLSTLPEFSFARVQTKSDPKRPGEKLSMGYGFVGFQTKAGAARGLKALEGFEVDGKVLEAKFAQRGAEEVAKEVKGSKGELGGKTKSTKLLVKNIPFEASKSDLRDLFASYGSIKSLRLPKKPTLTTTGNKSARGFAFLEFTTHAEAQRAMEALKHTHLLGRHLVIEWAKQGESVDVEKLRQKVGNDVRGMEDWEQRAKGKRKFEAGGVANAEELDGLEV